MPVRLGFLSHAAKTALILIAFTLLAGAPVFAQYSTMQSVVLNVPPNPALAGHATVEACDLNGSTGSGGVVAFRADGSFTYTPPFGKSGTDRCDDPTSSAKPRLSFDVLTCTTVPRIDSDGGTTTAQTFAQNIIDPSTIDSATVAGTYTGAPGAIGNFSSASCVGATALSQGQPNGLATGVILSTGAVRNIEDNEHTHSVIGKESLPDQRQGMPIDTVYGPVVNSRRTAFLLPGTTIDPSNNGLIYPEGVNVPFPYNPAFPVVVDSSGIAHVQGDYAFLVKGAFALPQGATITRVGSELRYSTIEGYGGILPSGIFINPGTLTTAVVAFANGTSARYFNASGVPVTVNFTVQRSLPADTLVTPDGPIYLPDGSVALPAGQPLPGMSLFPNDRIVINADGSFTRNGQLFTVPDNYDDYFALSNTTQDELISWNNKTPGDPVLDALIGNSTLDAASLSVNFRTAFPWIEMTYVFSSDEYNEFVNQSYNDTFAFILNGKNIALLPNSQIPVSVNSVNNGNGPDDPAGPKNPQFYIDNKDHHICASVRSDKSDCFDPSARVAFQMDGTTVVMKVAAPVVPGALNNLRMSVADVGDAYGDTNVFVKLHSLKGIADPTTSGSGADMDFDSDGVIDLRDNCPFVFNPDQYYTPTLGSTEGDACRDRDHDGVVDVDPATHQMLDVCPLDPTNSNDCNGTNLPPSVDFTKLQTANACVIGPWGGVNNPNPNGSPTFTLNVSRNAPANPADPYNLTVNLTYNDPGPVAGQAYSISIKNAIVSNFAAANTVYGPGVDFIAPCTVNSDSTAQCEIYTVDSDNGFPASSRPQGAPADLFRLRVLKSSNPALVGYTSGDYLNVGCADLKALYPPVALDNSVMTKVNTPVTLDPSLDDYSKARLVLTVSAVGTASKGTITKIGNLLTYTPTAGAKGSDSFTYTITDSVGLTSTGTVFVYINQPPVAQSLTPQNLAALLTAEDTPVTMNLAGLLDNHTASIILDADVEDVLTVKSVSTPLHGTVTINGDGTVTYQPALNYFGSDTFTYTVSDGINADVTASISLTVTAVNDPPAAKDDFYQLVPGATLTFPVLNNDMDVDDAKSTLKVAPLSSPAHGTLTLNLDGTFKYIADPTFVGRDSFQYSVTDPGSASGFAVVSINVSLTNQAPVATADSYATDEDVLLTVAAPGIFSNDSEPDGSPLTAIVVLRPSHGTLTLAADGSFTYLPVKDYSGTDSFTYKALDTSSLASPVVTVSLTVNAVNDPPAAKADSYSTNEDTALNVSSTSGVLVNDTDKETSKSLTIALVVPPMFGTLTLNADGSLKYVPMANFNGPDSFQYTLTDGGGAVSDPATVTINVISVNDLPAAVQDSFSTVRGTASTVSVLANDSDSDNDSLSVTSIPSKPSHGTAAINADGTITYTSVSSYIGSDSFTYQISDGHGGTATATVNVSVTAPGTNRPPTANADTAQAKAATSLFIDVLANDIDLDKDSLTITAVTTPTCGTATIKEGKILYDGSKCSAGSYSFTYTISDGRGGAATAKVTVTVAAENHKPEAANDYFTVTEFQPTVVNVLVNDKDADGDPLTITAVSKPVNGTAILNADGTITYTATSIGTCSGRGSFTYTISDGRGGTAAAVVTVVVKPVNKLPAAKADSATVTKNKALTINVLANDSDPNGDPLTITAMSSPGVAGATVATAYKNTKVVYTPKTNYVGPDSFTYTISDGRGGTAMATVSLKVCAMGDSDDDDDHHSWNGHYGDDDDDNRSNLDDCGNVKDRAPVTVKDQISAVAATATTANVLSNDSDPDQDALKVVAVSQPAHGTASFSATTNLLTYTSAAGYSGADMFTYTISDGRGATAVGVVNVTVTPGNQTILAKSDSGKTNRNTPITISVLTNDTGSSLSIKSVSIPSAGGTATIASGGTKVLYTPKNYYSGSDSFNYTITDGKSTSTASVSIRVCSSSSYGHDDDDCDDESDYKSTGKMIDGGSLYQNGAKVAYTMTLHCSPTAGSNSLQVSWSGKTFKLDSLKSASCIDSPSIGSGKAAEGFDTISGQGSGRYEGKAANIEFVFADAGSHGSNDYVSMVITVDKQIVLKVGTKISQGHHSACKK